ncbi:MAG: hypothetical protein LBC18_12985 [Opitutaceae bacterium]|nr:hypothetical protein [Opitutaceae bacterium]
MPANAAPAGIRLNRKQNSAPNIGPADREPARKASRRTRAPALHIITIQ